MAISDGDPRVFDPELFGRLHPAERWCAVRAFEMRPDRQGSLGRPGPADETPASVARSAVLEGVWLQAVVVGTGFLVLPYVVWRVVTLAGAADAGDLVLAGDPYFYALCAVVFAWGVIRHVQLNRLFVEKYGEDLRWFFLAVKRQVPVVDPNAPVGSAHNRMAAAYARIRDEGDPRVVAPEVVARLTRWERARLPSRFKARLWKVGLGKRRFPDEEPSILIARRVTEDAVAATARRVALIAFVVAVVVVSVGVANDVGGLLRFVAIGALLVLALTPLAWLFRRWQVRRWFAALPAVVPAEASSPVIGDPRVVAPVVWQRLTASEKRLARSRVHAPPVRGRGPEDLDPVEVARKVLISGITAAGVWLAVQVTVLTGLVIFSSVERFNPVGWWVTGGVSVGFLVGVLVWTLLRLAWVNRVFDTGVIGTEPAPRSETDRRPPPQASRAVADPEVPPVAPHVWDQLTPAEQRWVTSRALAGSPRVGDPDAADAVAAARELVDDAVTTVGVRVAVALMAPSVALLTLALLHYEVIGWWIAWGASLAVLAAVLIRLRQRRRYVAHLFDERLPEGVDGG